MKKTTSSTGYKTKGSRCMHSFERTVASLDRLEKYKRNVAKLLNRANPGSIN